MRKKSNPNYQPKRHPFLNPNDPTGQTFLVPLTQGYVAIIDAEDVDRIGQYTWHWLRKPGNDYGYAVRNRRQVYGEHGIQRMHLMLLPPKDGFVVDHINRDRLDNRKCNLRYATLEQSSQNREVRHLNQLGYRGVFKMPIGPRTPRDRYQAIIRTRSGYQRFGPFDTAEEAALAYDKWARENFGQFAVLNFPDQ